MIILVVPVKNVKPKTKYKTNINIKIQQDPINIFSNAFARHFSQKSMSFTTQVRITKVGEVINWFMSLVSNKEICSHRRVGRSGGPYP